MVCSAGGQHVARLSTASSNSSSTAKQALQNLDPATVAKAHRLSIPVGLLAGVFGSFVGVGGGVLIVPLLTGACKGLPQRYAQVTREPAKNAQVTWEPAKEDMERSTSLGLSLRALSRLDVKQKQLLLPMSVTGIACLYQACIIFQSMLLLSTSTHSYSEALLCKSVPGGCNSHAVQSARAGTQHDFLPSSTTSSYLCQPL